MGKNNAFVSMILIMGLYSNCGKVDFQALEVSQPLGVDEVHKACAGGIQSTLDVPIAFSNPGALSCEYGMNGNLEAEDGLPAVTSFRGRIEQIEPFALPKDSIICGMEFSFNDINMEYDDHFILAFDKVVLASSYNFSPYLNKEAGLNLYDWNSIKGVDWPVGPDPLNKIFCEGSSSECSWPQTQQLGKMNMKFSDQVFQNIFALRSTALTHHFSLITIGDGDVNDCRIAPISFMAKVKYVRK